MCVTLFLHPPICSPLASVPCVHTHNSSKALSHLKTTVSGCRWVTRFMHSQCLWSAYTSGSGSLCEVNLSPANVGMLSSDKSGKGRHSSDREGGVNPLESGAAPASPCRRQLHGKTYQMALLSASESPPSAESISTGDMFPSCKSGNLKYIYIYILDFPRKKVLI